MNCLNYVNSILLVVLLNSVACTTMSENGAPLSKSQPTQIKNESGKRLKDIPELANSVRKFPEKSLSFVSQHRAHDLAQDDYFIKVFRDLIQSRNLTTEEKVAAFFLMKRSFGWGFDGTVFIRQGDTYFKTFKGELIFHARIGTAVQDLKIDAAPYLAFVQSHSGTDVLLAGNALLMAAIVDKSTSKPTIQSFANLDRAAQTQIPEIIFNYMCHSLVFAMDDAIVPSLVRILNEYPSEETKEDIINLLAIYVNTEGHDAIFQYLTDESDPANDLAIETGIQALQKIVHPDELNLKIHKLLEQASGTWKEALIKRLTSSPSRYSLEGMTKIWGFASIIVVDDGYVVTGPKGYKVFSPTLTQQ